MILCNECGSPLDSGINPCVICGSPSVAGIRPSPAKDLKSQTTAVASPEACSFCGTKQKPGDRFCEECGKPQPGSGEAASTAGAERLRSEIEEGRRRAEQQRLRAAEDAQIAAQQARLKHEAEARQRAADKARALEQQQRAAAEAQQQADAAARRLAEEQERERLAAEARRRAAEEARLLAEQQERERLEAEARAQAAAEARALAERQERERQEAEARARAAAEALALAERQEQERRAAEARQRAEEEGARLLAEQQQGERLEAEARERAAAEALALAEREECERQEAEARQRALAEEEARAAAAQQEQARAESDAHLLAAETDLLAGEPSRRQSHEAAPGDDPQAVPLDSATELSSSGATVRALDNEIHTIASEDEPDIAGVPTPPINQNDIVVSAATDERAPAFADRAVVASSGSSNDDNFLFDETWNFTTPPTPRGRSRWLIAAVGIVSLVVVAAGLLMLRAGPDKRPPVTPLPTSPVAPKGMAYVPGGEFLMGNDGTDEYEKPPHKVRVSPFFIDIYEVTCEDYERFIKATGHKPPPSWTGGAYPSGAARHPVTGVDWNDASAYAQWTKGRLPTEEEWEFAARGTTGWRYPWGDQWRTGAANADGASTALADVGSYQGSSPFGVFDMVGNGWEWTSSSVHSYPGGTIKEDNLPPDRREKIKVIRGGCYLSTEAEATVYRRGRLEASGMKYDQTGFRCVRDVPANPNHVE